RRDCQAKRARNARSSAIFVPMPTVTIYHNPRCSKSRATLQLLQDRGLAPRVIEYLKTPPSVEELRRLLTRLGKTPRELLRRSEAEYEECKLDTATDAQILSAMVK